jgi:5-methylcytosine-specific restriction endonuclease McrA
MRKPKLVIELIPNTCHYSNARTTLPKKDWDKIRFIAYEKAKNKCEICKGVGTEQGFRHKLECHEVWEYNDETKTQKLTRLMSLCPMCHQTKHIGRPFAMNKQAEVFKHMERVNKWNHKEIVTHVAEAYQIHNERSKFQWKMDLSLLLNEPYNLKFKSPTKRKFKLKYKRKKRKSK